MGRPDTKPKDLRDGYIEVHDKNKNTDLFIRRESLEQLLIAINE